MRIQSNGLPDHCVPGTKPMKESKIDIKFKYDSSPLSFNKMPRNVNDLNNMICNFDQSSND